MSTRRATSPAAKPGRRPYHHGDLRRALLDAAVSFLADHEVVSLNLQVVAKAAHVSPGAPYHHFADKVELLAALATEGFATLFEALQQASERQREPNARLREFVVAYLDFAAQAPSHYRVMFLSDLGDRVRFRELHEMSGRSLDLLRQLLSAQLPGESALALSARSVAAFATCHGFASLRAAGVLTNIPGLPSLGVLRRAAAAQVVAGLQASSPR